MSSGHRPVGLHVGLPRTGSKTLQWQLFSRHREIHYLGIFEPHRQELAFRPHRRSRCAAATELLDDRLHHGARRLDLGRCHRLWSDLLDDIPSDRTPVWSHEIISWGTRAERRIRAENFWRVLRRCRVLMVVREPLDLLASTYRMFLRSHQITPDSLGDWMGSFDEWWADPGLEPYAKTLDYAHTIEIYRQLFGEEAVLVLLFEELRDDPRAFFARVCRHLGVDAAAGRRLYRGSGDNARITDRQIQRFVRLRENPLLWRLVGRLRPGLRAALLRPPKHRGAATDRLSDEHVAQVLEVTRPQNRWLRDELGLPVERHGYAL